MGIMKSPGEWLPSLLGGLAMSAIAAVIGSVASAATTDAANMLPGVASAAPRVVPTLFVAGDSTAAKGPTAAQEGWGEPLTWYFDPAKLKVVNAAVGGRSSRTFITQGHWDGLLAQLQPGDFVLLQFGHNDNGALNQEPPGSGRPLRARGSIAGVGEDSAEIDNVVTGRHEQVHSFGWYLRRMIADVRQKGATPILLSLTARNLWKDGRVECGSGDYRQWDAEVARSAQVEFIDLTRILADRYQAMGAAAVQEFFSIDYLHTNPSGAYFNAAAVVSGLRALPAGPFAAALSATGRAVAPDVGAQSGSVCPNISG
jgi:lysophospholipase L1-like esterase